MGTTCGCSSSAPSLSSKHLSSPFLVLALHTNCPVVGVQDVPVQGVSCTHTWIGAAQKYNPRALLRALSSSLCFSPSIQLLHGMLPLAQDLAWCSAPLCEGRSCPRARLAKRRELFAECIYCLCIIYELEGFDHHPSLPEAGTERSGGWSCKLDGALLLSSQQILGSVWEFKSRMAAFAMWGRAAEAALAATPGWPRHRAVTHWAHWEGSSSIFNGLGTRAASIMDTSRSRSFAICLTLETRCFWV